MIYVVATLTIKPGSLEAIRAASAKVIAATRLEDGCISHDLLQDLHQPETLVFVERWRSRDDLTAHAQAPHVAAWRDATGPHIVARKLEIIHAGDVERH